MNIKTILGIVAIIISLGVYTRILITPVLIEAIQQETTKIENHIDTKINNKFKKIDELTTNIPNAITPTSTITPKSTISNECPGGSICIPIENLTRKQKNRLNLR